MESSGSCSPSTFLANTSLSLGILAHEDEMPVEGAFKCKLCSRAFKNARARGGHQKAHRQLRAPQLKNKKKKANKDRRPVRSLARIWPCSYATALRSACLRAQPFGDWRSHYDPSVSAMPPASLSRQTGAVLLLLAQLSSTSLAAGYHGTGDGGHVGHQQRVSEVDPEEPADGIDLTLKL